MSEKEKLVARSLERLLQDSIFSKGFQLHGDYPTFIDLLNRDKSEIYVALEQNPPTAKLWLKSRLFEAVLASAGLDKYLEALASYTGEKPEEDVRLNFPLASLLITTALNPFTLELIRKLKNARTLDVSESQMDAISSILKPNRSFTIAWNDVQFSNNQLEDIRAALLRNALDMLAASKQLETDEYLAFKTRKGVAELDKTPTTLAYLGSIPEFTVEQLTAISRSYDSSLKLRIAGGYVVWRFLDEPAIYLRADSAYYSPTQSIQNRANEKKKAERQLYLILEKLETTRRSRNVLCSICRENYTSSIMYHENKGLVAVCEKCAKDPKVIGRVAQIRDKR
jgi:hypothetical protein